MKLLVFNEIYYRGGGNRYMIDCINSLSKLYTKVLILTNRDNLFPEDSARLKVDVTIKKINFLKRMSIHKKKGRWASLIFKVRSLVYQQLQFFFLIFYTFKFYILIKKLSPDRVLSCNGGYPAALSCLAVSIAARLAKVTVVLSIVSMPSPRRYFYEKFLDKVISNSVGVIIVNSQNIANALTDLRQIPSEKIKIIRNCIEDMIFSLSTKNSSDVFKIGCITRMDESKGVLLLLDAFEVVSKKNESARLILAGHGDASDELQMRIMKRKLSDKVQLLGYYDDDIFDLIATFDLYVFPSFWEGVPYSIIEAMSSARAIIATKVGGIPEIINDGVEGVLINPNSTTEIIESMKKLINNQNLRSKIAKNARKKFEQELTYDIMEKRLQTLFENI